MNIPADLPRLPRRPVDGHKGTFGRVLVIAGSYGMSGAAVLCGSGALRSGAGLVRVATPESILPTVALGNPCYTTLPLPVNSQGHLEPSRCEQFEAWLDQADSLAVGPGLGSCDGVARIVQDLWQTFGDKPLALDADGLNQLAAHLPELQPRAGPTVLTPHPGEFARLTGVSSAEVQQRRRQLAEEFAAKYRLVLLLKGHETVITDGSRTSINTTGNPGMATGGSGDVLTGIIAAFMAQKLPPLDAARLGAWVHGRAGDLAADELSQVALTATDLVGYLPRVFRELELSPSESSE